MNGNIEISTVVGCKMMCSYCPQSIHVNSYAAKSKEFVMSLDSFKEYISSIPESVSIVFAGMAEPFLNPEAVEMVKHAHQKGHVISVYTTGVGLKSHDVLELKKLSFNHFCLHLPDEEGMMNLNITDQYIETVKDLMPIQKNIMCIGTLHPRLRAALGINVTGSTKGLYSRGGNLKDLMIPRKGGKLHCSACSEKLNHNILMPNGDVLLCCMDYNQDHVIGNLNEIDYIDLFESKEYQRVQQGLSGDETIDILCRKCEISKP